MEQTLTLSVNGQSTTITTDPERPLLHVLREDWDLTGAKYACGEGRCGACTVLVDGRPVRSCTTPIRTVENMSIVTIEALASGDRLHPVQEAFLQEGAFQCGYCTSGMILSAVALLQHDPHASDQAIQQQMNGHICRCNGYPKILAAIRRAARAIQE